MKSHIRLSFNRSRLLETEHLEDREGHDSILDLLCVIEFCRGRSVYLFAESSFVPLIGAQNEGLICHESRIISSVHLAILFKLLVR